MRVALSDSSGRGGGSCSAGRCTRLSMEVRKVPWIRRRSRMRLSGLHFWMAASNPGFIWIICVAQTGESTRTVRRPLVSRSGCECLAICSPTARDQMALRNRALPRGRSMKEAVSLAMTWSMGMNPPEGVWFSGFFLFPVSMIDFIAVTCLVLKGALL